MKKASLVIAITAAALLGPVHAQAEGWYTGQLGRVQLNSVGQLMVWFNGTNNECGSTRADYTATTTDAAGKSILAALLSWQAQGKVVSVYISNCSSSRGLFTDIADPG